MNIFDFFHHTDPKGNVTAIHGTGALDRPEHYQNPEAPNHSEIEGAMQPAQWVEKNPTNGFATYPKRNQGIKSDCTCYSAGKVLSIDYLQETGVWRELSPDTVYPFVVQPGGGANFLDVMAFTTNSGMGVDALYPSDTLTEVQAENKALVPPDEKVIGTLYRPQQWIQCLSDFETIASILQSYQTQGIKKGVSISVIGQNNGTWLTTQPNPPQGTNGTWYHRVLVTDFGLINGVKCLAIDNSWGTSPGNQGQQFLTEAYAPFIYGAAYTLPQQDPTLITPPNKPVHQWTAQLQIGSTGPEVLVLQQALQSMGFFPVSSVIAPTGSYFGITKAAVVLFQAAFGLPQTGVVDAPTITQLNSIFKS